MEEPKIYGETLGRLAIAFGLDVPKLRERFEKFRPAGSATEELLIVAKKIGVSPSDAIAAFRRVKKENTANNRVGTTKPTGHSVPAVPDVEHGG